MSNDFDVVIAGGGPAGMSAALILGRARRKVLLCDAGTPRNARAHGVNGFVTRDGTPPAEMRAIAARERAKYPNVASRSVLVESITGSAGAFTVGLGDGSAVTASRVILAGGVVDSFPETPGIAEGWARFIFPCPFCDGWERQDKPWGALVTSANISVPPAMIVEWVQVLSTWTSDLVLFTNATADSDALAAQIEGLGRGLRVETEAVARVVPQAGSDGQRLDFVELASGKRVAREALFMRPFQSPTPLVQKLGLALDANGYVKVDARKESSIPGILVVGDATTMMQGALLGAADGAMAAYATHHALAVHAAH